MNPLATLTPTAPITPSHGGRLAQTLPEPDWPYHAAFRRQLFATTPDIALPKYLLAPEIRQLAALPITQHQRMLLLSLFNTGARINELLDLTCPFVTTLTQEGYRPITFVKLRTLKQQRRDKPGRAPKENFRMVKLYDPYFAQEFLQYMATHCSNKKGYVFASQTARARKVRVRALTPPISDQTARNWLADIEAVGRTHGIELLIPLTPKVLRHSCAVHMVLNRLPLSMVQAHLGHKSRETTELYSKLLFVDDQANLTLNF